MGSTPSKTRLICSLTAGDPRAMREDMQAAAEKGADAVEVRLDYLDPTPDSDQLRDLLAGPTIDVIATCRPVREGGRFDGDEDRRLELLRQAKQLGAAWVDVELSAGEQPSPPAGVIVSHHDFDRRPEDLDAVVAALHNRNAEVNKIAFAAAGPQDALYALDVLHSARRPTIALAMGEAGVLSRILAKKFDAFATFAALQAGAESAPGQPTLDQFRQLYRWDQQTAETAVYGVIGCPVAHSMSPAIHNAAFSATNTDAVYVPLLIQPGAENFHSFMDALLARPWLDWRGLSVTIPHKENALAYVGADNCDPLAVRIGAVNTVTIGPNGTLRGDNTDYAAAIDALCDAMGIERDALAGKTAAVIGAGGAARAIVAALDHYRAEVTIYNRTLSRAEQLAEEFNATAKPLDQAGTTEAEIIINCTSIGMHPHVDASPLAAIPPTAKVVFDTIYNPIDTRLLSLAAAANLLTVSGVDMFVNQAVAQFETWTATGAPRDVMRKVVLDRL